MIDGRTILLNRIQALGQDLAQARQALDATEVDDELSKRVRVPFGDLISELQDELARVRKLSETSSLPEAWAFFQSTNAACEILLSECLDFVQGALARSAGIDFGLCRIADALLMELGRRGDITWTRFTIPAVGEFFHDMAQIIRVRFPDSTIWSLPVACHEFGHFAEQQISKRSNGQTRYPIKEILEQEGRNDPNSVPYLRELFADLFATYALGPAYAYTCVLLRFDPSTAYVDGQAYDGKTHPSSAKRVYFILNALKKMDQTEIAQPYGRSIKTLTDLWQLSVGQDLSPADTVQLDYSLEMFYEALSKKRSLQYSWGPALELIPTLMSSNTLSDGALKQIAQRGATLSDVLNAAWFCRLEKWDDAAQVYQIGENAKKLCNELCRTGN